MPDLPARGLPESVYKRDGRLVAFEADKISQSLYAATQELGHPNPFLARELTDGVLHFLAAELDVDVPTTAQIAEIVAKVVRELGQPALAQRFLERERRKHREPPDDILREKSARQNVVVQFSTKDAPDAVARQCLRAYSLQAVFARDLAAAHEEGLLTLTGLENPDELARQVLAPNADRAGGLAFVDAAARTIIVDSPEYDLTETTVRPWLRELADFCETTGRRAVVNVHTATPPPWAVPHAGGPLFAPHRELPASELAGHVARLLVEENNLLGSSGVYIEWHLSDGDFKPDQCQELERITRYAASGGRVSFVFDRPRRPLALGPGVDRTHGAVLLDIALELPRLLTRTGVDGDAGLFLAKLPSLARMALRGGIQKRNYLRSRGGARPGLARGFLVERARLVVIPGGLEAVVQSLLGQPMSASKLSLDLGRQIIDILQRTLQTDGQAINLDIALDVNVTAELGTPPTNQLEVAAALHKVTGIGTFASAGLTPTELLGTLTQAWKKTDVARVA